MNLGYFKCEFCNKKFVDEKKFSQHNCEAKKRYKQVKTKIGYKALNVYNYWRRLRKMSMSEDASMFITSRYFNSFITFINFCSKNNIPDIFGYVDYCVSKTLLPNNWYSEVVCSEYFFEFDRIYSPKKQIKITIKFLDSIAQIMECDINEVIPNLYFNEIIKFITSRKISPWVLMFSDGFSSLLSHFQDQERFILESASRLSEWQQMITENKEHASYCFNMVKSLGL